MTPCLIVDTSIQGVAVAIADLAAGGRLVYHEQHPENMGSVVAIAGLVQQGLARTGLEPQALAACAVAAGPGSFTGIKVGLAFVYGLKLAAERELPMLGLSAVEAAARSQAAAGEGFALFLPATRTHGFVGVHRPDGTAESALVDATDAGALTDLMSRLPPTGRLGIVGGWPLLQEALAAAGRPAAALTASDACRQAIHGMAELAAARWPQCFGTTIPEPRYLRLSTAEEKLQQQRLAQGGPTS